MAAGYSGTPLPKKLGLTARTCLLVIGEPAEYSTLVGALPPELQRVSALSTAVNVVHLFVTDRQVMGAQLKRLRERLSPEAVVWVSWPKKTSKVPSTVTEDVIRELALPLGFVDIKVCAVSDVWSGLKLVVRKELRVVNAR